jgi:hypothetical protein
VYALGSASWAFALATKRKGAIIPNATQSVSRRGTDAAQFQSSTIEAPPTAFRKIMRRHRKIILKACSPMARDIHLLFDIDLRTTAPT